MMLMLSMVAVNSLAASEIGLAITKRSGVSKPVAAARAKLLAETLGLGAFELEDLTSCQSRLPCIVKAARAKKWTTLVTVETANVLADAIVDVRVLSVEEDGRELARGNAQVPEARLGDALQKGLPDVRKALKPPEPVPTPAVEPAVVVRPAPAVVESPPPPPPVVSVEPVMARPAARWIPLGVSLGVLAAGGLSLGLSEGAAGRLRNERPLTQQTIDELASSGQTLRTLGFAGLISGATLSVASLILALVWPESPVVAGMALDRDVGSLLVSGRLP